MGVRSIYREKFSRETTSLAYSCCFFFLWGLFALDIDCYYTELWRELQEIVDKEWKPMERNSLSSPSPEVASGHGSLSALQTVYS